MNRRKAAYFDSQIEAPWANAEFGPDEKAKLDRLFSEVEVGEGARVLEPGCGTGRLTEILAGRVGPRGRVVALDISPKMVEAALRRVARFQNTEVHLAAVEEFPLQGGSFDVVMCHQVFPHFDDKERALEILVRTLKPGGKLVVFHFINFSQINDRHRKACTAVEDDMMPSPEKMECLFDAAGLTVHGLRDDEYGYLLTASRK